MIIELFGAPASGKSTLAIALVIALRKKGFKVQLNASARSTERAANNDDMITDSANPQSPAAKLVNIIQLLIMPDHTDEVAVNLLRTLPPISWASKARLRRYLSYLQRTWKAARAHDGITIFDQGYLTALCSLAVRAKIFDARNLSQSLALLPRPDLLIFMDTPRDVLQVRRTQRLARQNPLERIFEQSCEANQKQLEMVSIVADMAQTRHWPFIHINCVEQIALESAVAKIVQGLTTLGKAA